MSESSGARTVAGQPLPIIVRWKRRTGLWFALAWLALTGASLFLVLAAQPVPQDGVRGLGIVAIVMLVWSLVRRGWMDSRADQASHRAPDLLDRWPIIVAAAAAGAAYIVFSPFALSPLAVQIVGLIGLSFFGLTGAIWFIVRPPRSVALRIDEAGILDHTTLLASPQPIRWSEIQSVAIRRQSGQTWIVLGLVRPAEFVSQQAFWRRPLLRGNWALIGSPLALHASGLDLAPDTLASAIQTLLTPPLDTTSIA